MSKREADGYCAWHSEYGKQLFFADDPRQLEQMEFECAERGWELLSRLWLSTEPPEEWVSFDDEDPPAYVPVMLCDIDGAIYLGGMSMDGCISYDFGVETLKDKTFTHWRPLPLPPKSEGEKDAK